LNQQRHDINLFNKSKLTFTPITMSTRSNRFSNSFQPLRSTSIKMRSIATAFSPTRSSRSASQTSYSSTSTTSPLTASRDVSRSYASGSYSRNSSPQSSRSGHSLAEMLAIRRRPSTLEFEMQVEMQTYGCELDVLEPRPMEGGHASVMGIFEVLDGKC
jgi:hypothetical protein